MNANKKKHAIDFERVLDVLISQKGTYCDGWCIFEALRCPMDSICYKPYQSIGEMEKARYLRALELKTPEQILEILL